MTDKLQTIEKHIKIDNRVIQTETEEFKGEPTVPLHYKIREGVAQVVRKPTLFYGEVKCNPIEILYFRRSVEDVVSNVMHLPYVKQILNSE